MVRAVGEESNAKRRPEGQEDRRRRQMRRCPDVERAGSRLVECRKGETKTVGNGESKAGIQSLALCTRVNVTSQPAGLGERSGRGWKVWLCLRAFGGRHYWTKRGSTTLEAERADGVQTQDARCRCVQDEEGSGASDGDRRAGDDTARGTGGFGYCRSEMSAQGGGGECRLDIRPEPSASSGLKAGLPYSVAGCANRACCQLLLLSQAMAIGCTLTPGLSLLGGVALGA